MIARSVIKSASLLAGLTYFGSHGVLAYHLAVHNSRDPLSKISSEPISISVQKERESLVNAVIGLYQLDYSNEKMLKYAHNAIFEDPFARLESRRALASGMHMMLSAFSKGETLHSNVIHGNDNIILELTQEYTLRGLGLKFRVPSIIYLTLVGAPGQEQITKHVEEWGGKPLLTREDNKLWSIPEGIRKIHGKVSTMVFAVPKGLKE